MTCKPYDSGALARLSDKVGYEIWLLEAVYSLVEDQLFPDWPDAIIYPLATNKPVFIVHASMHLVVGDWRPGFIDNGAPLVFTASFKLLDMLLEWVLEQNGYVPSHRYAEKIGTLKGPVTYPAVIESRPWLRDRLRALFASAEPLRGTIIHSRHFRSEDGTLQVSSSKRGVVGPEIVLTREQLRTFAAVCVSVLRYIDGAWSLEPHRENALRWQLDQLASLHGLPTLAQKEPYRATVRVFIEGGDPRIVDVDRIRADIAAHYPRSDCFFDLRVLQVKGDSVVSAWLVPGTSLDDLKAMADFDRHRLNIPDDVDPGHYRMP